MWNKKTGAALLTIVLLAASLVYSQSLADNWNDFLHYVKIGRFDLAKGYGRALIDAKPAPVDVLALSEDNPQGTTILLRVRQTAADTELKELASAVLDIAEQGRFIRRTDPAIITREIRRLSGTARGRLAAVKRLRNAGEYAVSFMLAAMADESRKEELPNIIWALPQIGRPAIRPLVAAMQTDDVGVKAEIIKALGKIGYPRSLAYLKYVVENEQSKTLCDLASESIRQIDPAASKLSAAQLFYNLAEQYYYHAESLAPAEDADFANMWFWNSQDRSLSREKVDKDYFNELMAMRCSQWALKADAGFGQAIGLWLASFFQAESAGIDMPAYFGSDHPDAFVYATTAGPEYLHQALDRALNDRCAYVALGAVEALAATAGEKSLFYRLGTSQPLVRALSFNNKAVRYSAAIAIAAAGPRQNFPESKLVIRNLIEALQASGEQTPGDEQLLDEKLKTSYALRAARVMLELARNRNPVIDLSAARDALINVTRDRQPELQVPAARILARLNSPAAQRAIAETALRDRNPMDVRIAAFEALAESAKLHASLLDDQRIKDIYSLVSSKDIDPQLQSAAARAYGSLNLPSEKVKDLILEQAVS